MVRLTVMTCVSAISAEPSGHRRNHSPVLSDYGRTSSDRDDTDAISTSMARALAGVARLSTGIAFGQGTDPVSMGERSVRCPGSEG